jgi:hypothetical protein
MDAAEAVIGTGAVDALLNKQQKINRMEDLYESSNSGR